MPIEFFPRKIFFGQKDFTLCDEILKKIHPPFLSPYFRAASAKRVFPRIEIGKENRSTFDRKPPTNYSIIVCHRPLRWLHAPTCTKQIRFRLHRYETRVNVEPLYLEIPFPYFNNRHNFYSILDSTPANSINED